MPTKPRVLITRLLPEPALDLVQQTCDVQYYAADQHLPAADLRRAIVDKEGVICQITDQMHAEILTLGRRLKVVANVAVGYDNIDVPAATQRGIVVTNTPGVLTETTADLAWGLLYSIAR